MSKRNCLFELAMLSMISFFLSYLTQYLSRIWTHPRVLGIAQRRQDLANQYKWDEEEEAEDNASDLDGFLDDEVGDRRLIDFY